LHKKQKTIFLRFKVHEYEFGLSLQNLHEKHIGTCYVYIIEITGTKGCFTTCPYFWRLGKCKKLVHDYVAWFSHLKDGHEMLRPCLDMIRTCVECLKHAGTMI
jgi:hypothetical protein